MIYQNSDRFDLRIETMRGLACILLVAYHVIGDTPQSGLRVESDSIFHYLNNVFSYIRMPLFTFLSGYVYGLRPLNENVSGFINGKIRRLLVPMFIVGTMFALLQTLTPGTNYSIPDKEWLTIHIKPVAHYWFLEALFLIFLGVVILEKLNLMSTGPKFIMILFVASFIHLLPAEVPQTLGLHGAIYLFPYFLVGLASYRFSTDLYKPYVLVPLGGIFIIFIVYTTAGVFGIAQESQKFSIASLVVGSCSSILLLYIGWKQSLLVRIGQYSYSIFLFHIFATAASRILLTRIGVTEQILLFLAGCVAGVGVPILIENVAVKFSLMRTLLLGKRWKSI